MKTKKDRPVDYEQRRLWSMAKRAHNRENSPKVLDEHGISYEAKSGGIHLIVTGNTCLIDFWPGTGRWIARNEKVGYGVWRLVAAILKDGL